MKHTQAISLQNIAKAFTYLLAHVGDNRTSFA